MTLLLVDLCATLWLVVVGGGGKQAIKVDKNELRSVHIVCWV